MYAPRNCTHCATSFTPRRHDQVFCSGPCKVDAGNLELKRARILYRELYHWRKARGRGQMGKLLGDVSRVMDGYIAEDRAQGRPPPPLPERIAQEDYMKLIRERGANL